MARTNDRERNPKRAPKEARPRGKRKVCVFCKDGSAFVDYKDVSLLRRFMSERGKIRSRRVTGNCSQHQRDVQVAIKTARELALLPYVQRTASERGPGRPRPAAGREDVVELEDGAAPDALAYDIDSDIAPELAEIEQ
jgi:small subunit ribosomal protein S18